jgi:hypothetical protein
MKPEQFGQDEQIRNVNLKDLVGLLRNDMKPQPENSVTAGHPYALIDMGRLSDDLRKDVAKKLEGFQYIPLLNDPRYEQLKWHGALLVYSSKSDDALLDEWGNCNGDIISAWIVSKLHEQVLTGHLRNATFAFDEDEARYLLRYYDPLITPVLHRLADETWVQWFFSPIVAWWYPVATPTEETWSRIAGGRRSNISRAVPLVLTEELWDALQSDPFPHRLLNFVEHKFPSFFDDDCYGVRLAKIEGLLEMGKNKGLKSPNDLNAYVLALLEDPKRAEEPRWQIALQNAVLGKAPLKTYFQRIIG